MLNSISIVGRLVREPDFRTTDNGISFCKVVIACERSRSNQDGQRTADFFDCVAWRSSADFLTKYFRKGDWIAINGRMESRTYENKDGIKQKVWEIQAENISFCGGASKSAGDSEDTPSGYDEVSADGNLPF